MSEPSPPPPPAPNRFKNLNVGEGVTDAELLQMASNGETDFGRTLLLRVQEQYWSNGQVYRFAIWASGISCLIITLVNWDDTKLNFAYFILGVGCSIVQAFFPHANKTCDKDAEFRPGQPCIQPTDCSTLPLEQMQQNQCNVQYGSMYKTIRMFQALILVLGIVLVVIGDKPKKGDASFSFIVGFSIVYTISYYLK